MVGRIVRAARKIPGTLVLGLVAFLSIYLRPAKNEKSGQSRGRSHDGSDHVIVT